MVTMACVSDRLCGLLQSATLMYLLGARITEVFLYKLEKNCLFFSFVKLELLSLRYANLSRLSVIIEILFVVIKPNHHQLINIQFMFLENQTQRV